MGTVKLYPWADSMSRLPGDNQLWYKSGYKYQATKDFWIKLPEGPEKVVRTWFIEYRPDGWLWIRRGYAWDGPSGPTIDTHTFIRGSLVHDALYQLMRMGLIPVSLKEMADNVLHRMCREDGMLWPRAAYVYKAMAFSGAAIDPGNQKLELVAPENKKKR